MGEQPTTEIIDVSIHYAGNKKNGETLRLSKSSVKLNNETSDLLSTYFLSAFRSQELFNLYHESGMSLNTVFSCAEKIFDSAESLHEQSVVLARHLFEQGEHPKIKGGEFYTVLFKNCFVNNESVDAVGLFKTETREDFIKVIPKGDQFVIEGDQGIPVNKLDKGCLIFNSEKENGYVVSVVDNSGKGSEARYWTDDFLGLRPRKDEYYNTQNALTLCKNFVTNELPQHFEVSRADQADLLNKSMKFFKENEQFNMKEFTQEVIGEPEVIKSFNQYRKNFQQEYDIEIGDRFDIAENAVKKQQRVFKSVIKLDRNFHIYIHGNRNMIEQGVDENGRKYYRIYYNEET